MFFFLKKYSLVEILLIGKSVFEEQRERSNGLLEKGVFEPVSKRAAEGRRIYESRFVDEVKNKGTPNAYEKSRLVVQAYNDRGHGLLTYSPTVQRSSKRMLFPSPPWLATGQ